MDVEKEEREWLRRIGGGGHATTIPQVQKEEKKTALSSSKSTTKESAKKKSLGFKDIAGMEDLKKLVTEGFINVLKNRECAEAFGITPPSILLYGPAGCGKTFFAEAVAGEVGINFMKVVPDDIACQFIHGTEEKIGEIFRKAEKNAPTILFFDEFEGMVPQRSEGDMHHQNGEVNEFLVKLNNASEKGVYVIAATNHPENIDRAVLRTGRIDELIYVDMPDKAAREGVFKLALSKYPKAEDIDYGKLADLTKGYNCSDISYIVKVTLRKAFNASIAEKGKPYKQVTQIALEEAIARRSPSVTAKELRECERIRSQFSPKDSGVKMQRIGFTM